MAITPQAIKDQEFQSKFRGYDTIEVKAYLELIAEEFFEQLEEVRQQVDEIDALSVERDKLQADKKSLEETLISVQERSEEKMAELVAKEDQITALESEKEERIAVLEIERDELKEQIEKQEEEKKEKDNELSAAEERSREKDGEVLEEKAEKKDLQRQLDEAKKQNEELNAVEVDFKSTLIMAQKFSHDIKEKSEAEAQEIIEIAIGESEKLRQETFDELARYPKEIEMLKEKRNKVRDNLVAALNSCLDNLEVFSDVGKVADDDGDLFQSIDLPLDDSGKENEFDGIKLDFSSPASSTDDGEAFSLESAEEEMVEDTERSIS